MITFWIAPRLIPNGFWTPTWPQIGETIPRILEHFSILELCWAQELSKTPPRSHLRPPRLPPRGLLAQIFDDFGFPPDDFGCFFHDLLLILLVDLEWISALVIQNPS